MDPQKSMVLPILLTLLGSGVVFGGGAYYLATVQNTPETVDTTQTTVRATKKPTANPTNSNAIIATASTTADETANWKTYTNTKYGFFFKYPETMDDPKTLGISGDLAGIESSNFSTYIKNDNYGRTGEASSLIFNIYEPSTEDKNLTLDQFVTKTVRNESSKQTTTIGGEKAIRVSFVNGGYTLGEQGKSYDSATVENGDLIFIKHSNNYLYIMLKALDKTKTQDIATLNSVINTIKFTK